MSKYFVNFLKWITHGKVLDKWLKTAHDFKQDGDKFSFKINADVNPKDWRFVSGSGK